MPQSDRNKKRQPHALVGSWTNGDEYKTSVEYTICRVGRSFTVRAIDRFDSEEGVVYDINYDAKASILSFGVRWPSTGVFISARLQALSENRVDYTYTYTKAEMWFRVGTEPISINEQPLISTRSKSKKRGAI